MKLRFLFTSFLLVIVGLFVESSPTANAQEIVPTVTQLVIHNGQLLDIDGTTDGKDTTFQIYDLSNQYQISSDPTSLKQHLAGKDAMQIQSYILENHLSLITTVKTNNNGQAPNIRLNQDVVAVLIVQTGDSYNQNGDKVFAQPTVINLPVKDDRVNNKGWSISLLNLRFYQVMCHRLCHLIWNNQQLLGLIVGQQHQVINHIVGYLQPGK
ncbi:hypothetical protein FO438_11750 [Weissella cibaria]|uniref:pilin N-terminal domain-containing protein n=1 Tax=Weissella cibaria TaxID=137591 RepID=UPI0011944709|nr:hypothetical protein [Weissella cibaria]TVV39354.1 hypothetical protein FO438_11750 [Weissella cibaria]